MPPPDRLRSTRRARLFGGALPALLVHAAGWAQSTNPEPARSAPAVPAAERAPDARLDKVEVVGTRSDAVQERRDSTAAKIVIGRDEIERFGDSSLGDVLKRLPGVTIQGRPGRGGAIRMRGLGSGYTQILLDGERLPPGFSLDSLQPEQVERIEILRAPTAETGARAIAGTINIVTRGGYTRRVNDVRLSTALENGRLQPGISWTRNDTAGALIYNWSLSAFRQNRASDATTTTVERDVATDAVTLDQRDVGTVRERRRGLHATGRLQWRGAEEGHGVVLTPLLVYGNGTSRRTGVLEQAVPLPAPDCAPRARGSAASFDFACPYDRSTTDGDGSYLLSRLNAQWNRRLGESTRLEARAGAGVSRQYSHSVREERTRGILSRTVEDGADTRDRTVTASAKLVSALDGGAHSVVAGVETEAHRRNVAATSRQDGEAQLADFGDDVAASSSRLAVYAQDEWNPTPGWAAHAGLRWEGIATSGSGEAGAEASNRSSVWSPLLHAVWKPDPKSRDQVRISLTRSYRSPTLGDLIARPSINPRFPIGGANTPTHPDRAGNPDLKPELATGIDVAVERYLPASGILSANVFHRRISDYMRSVTALETVSYSAQQRYVSRVRNIGDATTTGIELEAKFRLSDVLADAPRIDLRANASVFRSRVRQVPGPDNRLDQQPDASVNVGADQRLAGLPLTLGGNLNWTPGYDTRVSDAQTVRQGRKLVVDAYALWIFSPSAQLRVTASNLAPLDYVTRNTYEDARTRETSVTTAPTALNLQVRLEMKL